VCCSADNQWLAVVTTKGHRRVAGVHVYSLDNLKLHATLPAPPGHAYWPPVSAMSLSASGILALAVRDNGVLTYDVESKELTPWSSALAAAGMSAPREMASLPGQICNLSFDPTPGSSVLLAQTPSAIARMNLGKPPVVDAPAPSKKRRKKERERGPGGHGGGDGKSELQPRGGNPGQGGGGDVKVATLDNPCLLLSYFAPRQALLVERPWEEVLEQMPAPLYRHKFGT
jgi:U3 small nucleolar RNA-associated protein 4